MNAEGKPVGIHTETDVFRMVVDQWHYFTMQYGGSGLVAPLVAEALKP